MKWKHPFAGSSIWKQQLAESTKFSLVMDFHSVVRAPCRAHRVGGCQAQLASSTLCAMPVNYGWLRTHPSSFDWRQRLDDQVFSLEHLDPIGRQCVGPVHFIDPTGRGADVVAAPFDPHIALL